MSNLVFSLLLRTGLDLSPGSKADLNVEYCIVHGIYDMFEINALLFLCTIDACPGND